MKYAVELLAMAALATGVARGDVIVKADNTNNLNDAASWTNGVAPGINDIAQWDTAVTAANSAALGASMAWSGIRVVDPGGAIAINANTAGASLTIGTNGIDMAASITNVTIHPSLVIGGNQSWTINGGRYLTLFSANNTGTGTGDVTVSRTGAGTAILSTAQNGNSACWRNFAGNWIFTTGVTAIAQGQNGDALGRGSVTLSGGVLAQTNGNWNFNNPIIIGPGGGTIESRSTSTGARFMNLSGGISGNDPLAFNTTIAGSLGEGFVLDASNSFSGPVTINAGAVLKIGGNGTTNVLSNSNGTNGALDNVTAITNNGLLRMGRTDGYTFRPDLHITGSGTFRLNTGCAASVQSPVTIGSSLTLSLAAPLTLAGDQTVFGLSSLNAAETNGNVLGNATLTIAAGSTSGYLYYGGISGVTSLQLRVGAQTIAQANGSSSGSGNYFILQRSLSPSLALDTGISTASRKDFGWINDTDEVLRLSSLTGYGAIRGDAGGIAGHPRLITVDQSATTTFNGGLVAGGVNRNVIFNKTGSGSLTMAGFIGYQTAQSGVVNLNVSNGVLNVINDNATPANGTTGVWTTAGSGVLSFSSNGLGRGGASTIVMNGGTLRWNAGNSQDVSSRILINDGATATFDTGAGSVIFSNSPALGSASNAGVVKSGSGILTLAASNAHFGATIVSNGTLAFAGSGSCDNSARMLVLSGAAIDVMNRPDGALSIGASQTLAGAGSIAGNVNNDGALAPGEPVGLFVINGGLAQTNGTLDIEIGSASAFDQLLVMGNVAMGGALRVTLTNGFVPSVGDQFMILQALGLSGGFSTTNLPAIGTNIWTIDHSGGAITLSVTNPPAGPASGYDLYAQQISSIADRGCASDPDGDGFANLLEYATGGNPTNIDIVASMNGSRSGSALQIVFTRNTNSTDATLIVEGSDVVANDAPWSGILTNANGIWSGPAAFTETGTTNPVAVTVTDTILSTNRFLRLRVTRP